MCVCVCVCVCVRARVCMYDSVWGEVIKLQFVPKMLKLIIQSGGQIIDSEQL